MKINISSPEEIAKILKDAVGDIGGTTEARLDKGLEDVSRQAFEKAKELAAARLYTTKQQYIDALSLEQLGPNVYAVRLDASAAHIETGYCVLYAEGLSKDKQPKVYTQDGWKAVSEINVGEQVLNSKGKFTTVLEVHRNDLLDPIRLEYRPEGRTLSKPGTSQTREMGSLKCRQCGHEELQFKVGAKKLGKDSRLCPICVKSIFVVRITMADKSVLHLTRDHLVLTDKGYVRADQLTPEHSIQYLVDRFCERCAAPIHSAQSSPRYCSKSCSASVTNERLLREGVHYSQTETEKLRETWLKNLAKARKRSGLEDAFDRYFSPLGYRFIRQYPVSALNGVGQKTKYWLDFYLPDFNVAVEMDGSKFHRPERDSARDFNLKSQHGIDTIRITDQEWRKDHQACIQRVVRRLSNHSSLFQIVETRPKSIEWVFVENGFNVTTKFDLTVEDGHSFICQGIVVHNSSFDMKPGLLKNAKKRSKQGYRYRAIPMEQSSAPAKSSHPLHNRPVQYQGRVENGQMKLPMGATTQGSLSADFDALKKIGNRFAKGNLPSNFTGKAWTATPDPLNRNNAVITLGNGQQFKTNLGRPFNPMMAGLSNMRAQHESNPNKVRSAYLTFRIVSENPKQKNKWIHPGYNGAHILEATQRWTEENFAKMVDAILKDAA